MTSKQNKILVTGNSGAGKSTMATKLSEMLNLPFVSLDSVVWRPGWQRTPTEIQNREIEQIANRPSWVVDGVSFKLTRAADVVIFLDFKRRVSLVRCFHRNRKYLFKSRPELPEDCPEILILPKALRIIWRFPKHVRPKILAMTQDPDNACVLVHIQTNEQVDALYASVHRRLSQGLMPFDV